MTNAKSSPLTFGFDSCAHLFNCGFQNRGLVRLDFDEAACLYRYARDAKNILEIGRFAGGSTILIASALNDWSEPKGRLLSIDAAPRSDEALQSYLASKGLVRLVTLAVCKSRDFEYSPKKHGQFDLVFVDGGHDYETAKDDHLRWGRRLNVGGYIIHHDMAKARSNATQIVDLARLRSDILEHQGTCVELVEEVGSMAVFRRRGGCWRHF
jgi:predicted O-methyltransferase YrrM